MSHLPRIPYLAGQPLRVLSITHTAVSRAAGRLRYHPLAGRPNLDVHLVVPDRWIQFGRWSAADPPDDEGFHVHVEPIRLPRSGRAKWYLHHYPGLRRLIRQIDPQVIHLWEEPWSMVAWQAAGLRDRLAPKAALVLEVDQNVRRWLPPPFGSIRRSVLRRTDLVLARSDDAAGVVRGCGYRGPVERIGYGVDIASFHPSDRCAARAEFGLDQPAPGTLLIGYVGRLVVEKGLDDVIEAMALTEAPVTLAIMGEGPHHAALVAHAMRVGVSDRLRFHAWGDPDRVGRFMSALDALALMTRSTPIYREQFGRVVVEAHGCGVPVIGSSCGTIPDVVGQGGWIVAERDVAALAALLTRLAGDPALCTAAGTAGMAQASQRYTFERVAATLSAAWQQAHNQRNDSPTLTAALASSGFVPVSEHP